MLNYIWAGLIIFSFVFALAYDARDLASDTYRNGQPIDLALEFPDGFDPEARSLPVTVRFSDFRGAYGTSEDPTGAYSGILVQTADGRQVRFAKDAALPHPLETIRSFTSPRDNDLRGTLELGEVRADSVEAGGRAASGGEAVGDEASGVAAARGATAGRILLTRAGGVVTFPAVRFTKLQSIVQAAFDMAETAVNLALGLIGVMALWMGLIQIAEKSGMLHGMVRITQPVLRRLFPDIPKDHPAFAMIVLNLSANMLGLANAATPLGIKAMESLQELNPEKDTATDSMVMLLAMNTASVQLVPPVLLVAIMGLQINQLIFAILIVTGMSLGVAILSAKLLGRRKKHRLTNPHREGR